MKEQYNGIRSILKEMIEEDPLKRIHFDEILKRINSIDNELKYKEFKFLDDEVL